MEWAVSEDHPALIVHGTHLCSACGTWLLNCTHQKMMMVHA